MSKKKKKIPACLICFCQKWPENLIINFFWPYLLSSGNKNMDGGRQVTVSYIDEICPLAIPDQIYTISMHIPSLVKIYWYLLMSSSTNENMDSGRQITLSKIDEISPLAIPNQISTISMHIPSLEKIHWYFFLYHPETKIWTVVGR